MKKLTYISLIIGLMLICAIAKAQVMYGVMEESFLKIEGSTNLGKFYCLGTQFSDTIYLKKSHSFSELHIPVKKFGCQNIIMTTEFRKTLKYKQYPNIQVLISSIDRFPDNSKAIETTARINITLASITKSYYIPVIISSPSPGMLSLAGRHQLSFTEFKLEPPKFMGGSVKTNNELEVEFFLKIKRIGK